MIKGSEAFRYAQRSINKRCSERCTQVCSPHLSSMYTVKLISAGWIQPSQRNECDSDQIQIVLEWFYKVSHHFGMSLMVLQYTTLYNLYFLVRTALRKNGLCGYLFQEWQASICKQLSLTGGNFPVRTSRSGESKYLFCCGFGY